jgi:hypothetical protein
LGEVFDPLRLTKGASLNRTVLADLAGADARLVGRRAFDVLQLEALERLAAQHGISADQRPDVPRRLRSALGAADRGEADRGEEDRARQVVAEFGRRLGHLVATLQLGDDDSSEWRTVYAGAAPWRAAYRQHWRSVERVWLGGGVVAALGDELLEAARSEARRLGVDESAVDCAPHAEVLALVGAARTRATPAARAIVLDFGNSSVKRGIAHFHGEVLQRLDVLSGLPLAATGVRGAATGDQVMHAVVSVIRATFQEAHNDDQLPDGEVAVSLATYLTDRLPFPSSELYDLLTDVDVDALTAELTRAAGVPLHVRFIHDGTAAAAALQSNGREGIIVLGTSLGAGFTLPDQPRLPLAPNFEVIHR